MPTTDEIEQVKKNIANLMDLSNHTHDFLQDKIDEVYDMLSADAQDDHGRDFLCSLLETAFALAALVEFPGAAVIGAFLPTFLSAASPPDVDGDLKRKFGALRARFDKTFLDADDQFGKIHDDPAAYWDTTFTSPVDGKTTRVSHLGSPDVNMPDQHSGPYQTITDKVCSSFRQDLTKSVMNGLWYVYYSDYYSSWNYWTVDDFHKYAADYVAKYPAYFFKYRKAFVRKGGQNVDVIQYYNFSLVPEGSVTAVASDQMCNWLMEDDGYGSTTNAEGVAKRADVFFNWGLRQYFPDGKPTGLDQAVTLAAATAAAQEDTSLVEGTGPGQGPKPLPGPPDPKS